jgi:hypothetical protein
MIACSKILRDSNAIQQATYDATCIQPARKQLEIVKPSLIEKMRQCQDTIHRFGANLPPDLLAALAPQG